MLLKHTLLDAKPGTRKHTHDPPPPSNSSTALALTKIVKTKRCFLGGLRKVAFNTKEIKKPIFEAPIETRRLES